MIGSRIPSELNALSIAEEQEAVEMPPAQREELDRRLGAHQAAPGEGIPWEEVKESMEACT